MGERQVMEIRNFLGIVIQPLLFLFFYTLVNQLQNNDIFYIQSFTSHFNMHYLLCYYLHPTRQHFFFLSCTTYLSQPLMLHYANFMLPGGLREPGSWLGNTCLLKFYGETRHGILNRFHRFFSFLKNVFFAFVTWSTSMKKNEELPCRLRCPRSVKKSEECSRVVWDAPSFYSWI
jgi:hypothetical protein